MKKPRIGFSGLGLMGRAMVERLQDQGYAVTVLGHRDRTGIEAALARGASEAANGKALAEAQFLVQERFGLDAITACSDAFRITADLGAETAPLQDLGQRRGQVS